MCLESLPARASSRQSEPTPPMPPGPSLPDAVDDRPARKFLFALYHEIERDNAFNGAAALAYYFTLAIFPATIAVMALIPFLPIPEVDTAIMDLLRQALPSSAAVGATAGPVCSDVFILSYASDPSAVKRQRRPLPRPYRRAVLP